MDALRRNRVVDELVEAYVDWREACVRVDDAYCFWASEPPPGERVAFGSFMSALDAEEKAAEVYAGAVRRADKLPWSDDPPVQRTGGPVGGLAGDDCWSWWPH